MLNKLKQWAEKAVHTKQVDIDRFNDPIASRIEWTPARRGGTNFRTQKLKKDGYNTVEFQATWGASARGDFSYPTFLPRTFRNSGIKYRKNRKSNLQYLSEDYNPI